MIAFGASLRRPLCVEGGGVAVCVGGSLINDPRRTFLDERVVERPGVGCWAIGVGEVWYGSCVERGVEGIRQEGSSGGSGTFGSGEKCVACEAISMATLSAESRRLCAEEIEVDVNWTKSWKGPLEPLRLPGVELKTE